MGVMANDETTIFISGKSGHSIWIVVWGLIWFVVFNIAVWFVFDLHFFDWVRFDRLLMHPSDHELQSVMSKIKNETDKKHVVLLGDSIVWGIGENDSRKTIAGYLSEVLEKNNIDDTRVVNLAVPGNSFVDMYAMVESMYEEDRNDVYLFFINPMLFKEEYASRTFEEMVRFKTIVIDKIHDKNKEELEGCCGLIIPRNEVSLIEKKINEWFPWLSKLDPRNIPLSRNRDLVMKSIIGLQPYIAVDALLHRVLAMQFLNLFERRPMVVGADVREEDKEHRKSEELNNMLRMLKVIDRLLITKENKKTEKGVVVFMYLDENLLTGSVKRAYAEDFQKLVKNKSHNLSGKIQSKFYFDTVHMSEEGHKIVAGMVCDFLHTYYQFIPNICDAI